MTNWLTGWTYRKSHIINAQAGAGDHYQTCIKVYKTTGTDGTEVLDGETIGKVYVGANCRDDFGDVRFTDDNGTTELHYYMERLVSGSYAVFWVEVADSLETDPVTIYTYYGNAAVTTTSSMADTFLYSNDWEDQQVAWIKEAWQSGDSANATNKYLELVKGANQGANRYYKSIGSLSRLKCRIDMKTAEGATGRCPVFMLYNQGAVTSTYVAIGDSGVNVCEYYSGGAYHTIFSGITAQWYHFILKKVDVTPDTYDIYVYDETWTLKGSATGIAFVNVATTLDRIKALTYFANYSGQYDNFYICKYVSPEPAHSTWGTEEGNINNYTRTITEYIGGLDSESDIAGLYRTFTDYIGELESKISQSALYRTFTDYIGGLESKISQSTLYRIFTDYIGNLDSKTRIATLHETITDKIGGLDTRLRKVNLYRVFTDKLGLKDTRSRIAKLYRVFIDRLGALDTSIRYKARLFYRTIIEYIGLKDSKSRIAGFHRIFYEYMGLKERSVRLWNWFRRLYKYKNKEHPRQKVGKTGD